MRQTHLFQLLTLNFHHNARPWKNYNISLFIWHKRCTFIERWKFRKASRKFEIYRRGRHASGIWYPRVSQQLLCLFVEMIINMKNIFICSIITKSWTWCYHYHTTYTITVRYRQDCGVDNEAYNWWKENETVKELKSLKYT